jgi:hypothetical protein
VGRELGVGFFFFFLCFVREMMAENSGNREQDHERIRTVCAQVPLIDAHAHNVVGLDSNLPFLVCLREARGLDAVRQSLAFQRSLKELAVLYGCEPTLAAIEQYRQSVGLEAISQKCFDAANIEFVLLDDGLTMDKMVSIGWHRKFVPGVHRLLCIETVAEAILNQVLVNEFSSFFTKRAELNQLSSYMHDAVMFSSTALADVLHSSSHQFCLKDIFRVQENYEGFSRPWA